MHRVPIITLEEHFTSQAVKAFFETSGGDELDKFPDELKQNLIDVGPRRLASMDANNVAIQIVSHSPAQRAPAETLRAANDELAAHIRLTEQQQQQQQQYAGRLKGFAVLPLNDPAAAAAELERCVHSLGFVGALVDSHTPAGGFYDGAEYDVFWAKAEALGVPIYLHPTWPGDATGDALYGVAGRPVESMALGGWAFGWHAETGLHVLRLLAARVFERFPRLKLVLGHSGELLPFMWARTSRATEAWGLARSFDAVMRDNVWITTSGMFDVPSFRLLTSYMPRDRVLMSIDYPFSPNEKAEPFLSEVEKAGILTPDELEAFCYGNALKLFNLTMPTKVGN